MNETDGRYCLNCLIVRMIVKSRFVTARGRFATDVTMSPSVYVGVTPSREFPPASAVPKMRVDGQYEDAVSFQASSSGGLDGEAERVPVGVQLDAVVVVPAVIARARSSTTRPIPLFDKVAMRSASIGERARSCSAVMLCQTGRISKGSSLRWPSTDRRTRCRSTAA